MPWIKILFVLMFAIAALGQDLKAPQATRFYEPGDTIRFLIEFDGPTGGSIESCQVNLSLQREEPGQDNRHGYSTFGWMQTVRVSPKVFEMSIKVKDDTTGGDYVLSTIQLQAAGHTVVYVQGKDFTTSPIRIRNKGHIPIPKIKSVTELSDSSGK